MCAGVLEQGGGHRSWLAGCSDSQPSALHAAAGNSQRRLEVGRPGAVPPSHVPEPAWLHRGSGGIVQERQVTVMLCGPCCRLVVGKGRAICAGRVGDGVRPCARGAHRRRGHLPSHRCCRTCSLRLANAEGCVVCFVEALCRDWHSSDMHRPTKCVAQRSRAAAPHRCALSDAASSRHSLAGNVEEHHFWSRLSALPAMHALLLCKRGRVVQASLGAAGSDSTSVAALCWRQHCPAT